MGEISKRTRKQDRGNLEPSELHGKVMGRDTKIRDAVQNEGGIEPTHYA